MPEGSVVYELRFSTVVQAPLTVAFDVAQSLGMPWTRRLTEVESHRPTHDVQAAGPGRLFRRLTHTRRFVPTAAGTLVEEHLDWETALPGVLGGVVDRVVLRPRVLRAMRAHLDGYAVAAERRALDVVQVVGAAVVRDGRLLVAQRSGGAYDGCWEFPGGKVERGETELAGLVREIREELGVPIAPQDFLGEAPLDGVVGGGTAGASTLRVWWARLESGEPVAHEHRELRWIGPEELDRLDWIPADRPLLPAARARLASLRRGRLTP